MCAVKIKLHGVWKMQKFRWRGKAFVLLEWGEKPFHYLEPWDHRGLLGTMSLAVAVAHTHLFPYHPDPIQCYRPEIWTRLQPVGCVPLLTQHLPPHSTRIPPPAEPEVVGASCCRLHAALSCPKPGVNLCGVEKSVLWDKGVEMETEH